METTIEKQPDRVSFKTSVSHVQGIDFSPQTETEYRYPTEDASKKEGWFAQRFGKENGFGSGVIAADTIATAVLAMAGHKEKDKMRQISMSLATATNIWAFFSSRGAKMPEGDTLLKRVINAVKHPNQSSVHFTMLASIAISSMATAGNLYKGLQGGLERTRVITAAFEFLGVLMMTSGLFKKQEPHNAEEKQASEPVAFKNSNSRSLSFTGHLKGVYQYAWKTDKRGMVGRYVAMATQLSTLTEGLVKRNHTGKAAPGIVAYSAINIGVLLGNSFYTYDRLMRNAGSRQVPQSSQPDR